MLTSKSNQSISRKSKTENNREKYVKKKSFETIVITTNRNNRNVRLAEQKYNEVYIIPETQLSQNDKGEDEQVCIEKNNFCSMARVQYMDETIKDKYAPKIT